jgi:hypothetical protein
MLIHAFSQGSHTKYKTHFFVALKINQNCKHFSSCSLDTHPINQYSFQSSDADLKQDHFSYGAHSNEIHLGVVLVKREGALQTLAQF